MDPLPSRSQVKPLFKPASAARAATVPEPSVAPRGASYADYIVGQAVASSSSCTAAQLKPTFAAPAASARNILEEAPPQDQDESAVPPKSTAEDKGSPLNPTAPKAGAKHNTIIVSPRQVR